MLLDAFPKAAEMVDSYNNRTPLHLAIFRSSADITKMLLDAFPKAAEMVDSYKRTPLHCIGKDSSADNLFIKYKDLLNFESFETQLKYL